MSAQKKHRISAEDLYRLQLIADCVISPEGSHVVFCVQRVDKETEKKYSNLWLVPTDRGRARQFTYGDQSDSQPQWSPDGGQIAFISNRGDEKQAQIYIVPFHGGEARQLTNLKGDIGAFEWSPDGKQIVFMFRKKDKEAIEREENEQKRKLGIVSRRITRVFYSEDGAGFLPEERQHIWTVDVVKGQSKQLTDGDYDEFMPHWSPDGKEIVFCSNRSEEQNPWETDLFVIPAVGGDIRKIDTPLGPILNSAFSPDGKWLAYIGREGIKPWTLTSLWAVPVDGSEKARNLTKRFDVGIVRAILLVPTVDWSNDGNRLYFVVGHHGNATLKSVSLDDNEQDLQTVIGDEGAVISFSFNREQSQIAYLHQDFESSGEIWVHDMVTGRSRQLTRVSKALLQTLDLGEVEEVWFKGGSDNDLQGWILKPPGFDESKTYPSILEIHGGPQGMYSNSFQYERYCFAAQGYVVFFSNPRGGTGYGEEHLKAIEANWCSVDYDDLMAWTDFLGKKPYIDKERMGVTGHSYGGVMTNWIVGHTDRFKAAVPSASLSNMISLLGSSSLKHYIKLNIADRYPWEDFEQWWRSSPLKYAGNAKTPTLILVGQEDWGCPIEQSEQFYFALKKVGVDTELVLFPGECHNLPRTGRTDRRIAKINHSLRWFDRYLKDKSEAK